MQETKWRFGLPHVPSSVRDQKRIGPRDGWVRGWSRSAGRIGNKSIAGVSEGALAVSFSSATRG